MLRRLIDSPWFYFTLAGILAVVAVASQVEIRFASRPAGDIDDVAALGERDDTSVLFILIDTLRADRVGAYGYTRPTTPWIDRLAESGLRFERVEAQSTWTKASMASLWTSLNPVRTGVTRFDHALSAEAVLPAERLRDAGFKTAGIWRNSWVANNFGFAQGFDAYYQPKPKKSPDGIRRRTPTGMKLQGTDLDATEAALEFLRSYGDRRFLLYVHYMDVHQYLFDQEAADLGFGTSLSDAYDASVRWTDRNVGMLLEELDKRDLAKKTIVVVAADHGEALREHGREGHAQTLYREVTEVPLVIGLPFRLDPPVVVKPLVGNVDIWPTLFELLGLPQPEATDGRSLVPLIAAAARGEAPNGDSPPAYSFLDRTWTQAEREPAPLVSVRDEHGRLLVGKGSPPLVELYDHGNDPKERRDLSRTQADRVKALEPLAESFLAGKAPWGDSVAVEIDEIRRDQLLALGYVFDRKNDELRKTEPRPAPAARRRP
jgi:arylsulfatase A-like enzyme